MTQQLKAGTMTSPSRYMGTCCLGVLTSEAVGGVVAELVGAERAVSSPDVAPASSPVGVVELGKLFSDRLPVTRV